MIGKIVRHVSEHRHTKKLLVANFAAIAIASTLIPSFQTGSVQAASQVADTTVIEVQNTLKTQKTIQLPLARFQLNQPFSAFHPGVDLGADVGDPIKPMKNGKVIEADYVTDGYGNTVLIDHGQGLTTRYAHLSKIFVGVGQNVTTDDTIGLVGVTGNTTGPHLHFEVRIDGTAQNPLNYIPTN